MSEIRIYPNQKQIDRSEALLPESWLWAEGSSFLTESEGRNEQIRKILKNASTIVCLLTERIEDGTLVGYLHELAQRGCRVYLLLGTYSSALEPLLGHCLIRILPPESIPHGSLLLTDPGSDKAKSFLLSDPLVAQQEAKIGLLSPSREGEEGKELFHYFCYLFWERANKEYLCKEDRKGRDIVDKGRDVYFDHAQLHPYYLYDQFLSRSKGLSQGSLLGQYISLAEGMRHLRIEPSRELNLEDITFSQLPTKEELEGARPECFPDELGYLVTTYRWRVVPFYCPSGAEHSSYYKNWEEYTQNKKRELERLIETIEGERKKPRPEKGDDHARLYLDFERELSEIQEKVSLLIDFRWGYERNTSEKQNEEKGLKGQYAAACKELDLELQKLDLAQELTEIQKEIEMLEKNLAEHLEELKHQEAQGKDEQEKSKAKEAAQKKTAELNTEIKHRKGKEKEKEREIRRLKAQAHTPNPPSPLNNFYNPDSAQGGKSQKDKAKQPTTPILPSIGCLYQIGEKRYLAIESWGDYDEAHKEAQRLGAVLCAIEEGSK